MRTGLGHDANNVVDTRRVDGGGSGASGANLPVESQCPVGVDKVRKKGEMTQRDGRKMISSTNADLLGVISPRTISQLDSCRGSRPWLPETVCVEIHVAGVVGVGGLGDVANNTCDVGLAIFPGSFPGDTLLERKPYGEKGA